MKSTWYFAGITLLAASIGAWSYAQDIQRKVVRITNSQQDGEARGGADEIDLVVVGDGDELDGEIDLVLVGENGQHASKYWIGVMATPISDIVKNQLRLKTGLAVSEVVPKGPAAKAGVKSHDILLKANGKALSDIGSLIAAIGKADGKSLDLVLLRGGSEQKVKVTPANRPKGHGDMTFKWTEKPGDPKRLMFFGPGMQVFPGQEIDIEALLKKAQEGNAELNEQFQFHIEKSDEGPAKIVIKKNGKTFKATEDKLDKLPKDVRSLVEKHMKAHNNQRLPEGIFVPGGVNEFEFQPPRVHLDLPGMRNANKAMEEQMERVMEQMERVLKELDDIKNDRNHRPKRSKRNETTDA